MNIKSHDPELCPEKSMQEKKTHDPLLCAEKSRQCLSLWTGDTETLMFDINSEMWDKLNGHNIFLLIPCIYGYNKHYSRK